MCQDKQTTKSAGSVPDRLTGYDLVTRVLDHPHGGVEALIRVAASDQTETDWLEFKAGMYTRPQDRRPGEKDEDGFWHVAEAVIALANTRGGAVLVGIEDRTHAAVGLPACDPKKVVAKDGLEAYRRREILERINPASGCWATGLKGRWQIDGGRLPDGLVEIRGARYQEQDIAVILVRPAEPECIRVWKNDEVEQVLRRHLGHIGKVEGILGSKSMTAYEQSRRLAGEDLATIWKRFESENRPAVPAAPPDLNKAIAQYHRAIRNQPVFQEVIRMWTELAGEEQLDDLDDEFFEPIRVLDRFEPQGFELLPSEFDDVEQGDADEDEDVHESEDANAWEDDLHEDEYTGRCRFAKTVEARRGPILELLALEVRCVLIGEPGSGKSTVLRRLAVACFGRQGSDGAVAVFVPLYAFAGDLDALIHRVCGLTAVHRAHLTATGRLFLLLDGLNECPDEHLASCLSQIGQFVTDWPQMRIVVTTRNTDWQGQLSWPVFQVQPLGRTEQQAFLERRLGDAQKASHTIEFLYAHPGAELLANNPLLLRLVADVVEEGLELPRGRAHLYRLFLDNWHRRFEARKEHLRKLDEPWSRELVRNTLGRIAVATRLAGRTSCTLSFAVRQVPDVPAAEHLLRRYAGSLLYGLDYQTGELVFRHETFQEYLAAEAIVGGSVRPPRVAANKDAARWAMVFAYALELDPALNNETVEALGPACPLACLFSRVDTELLGEWMAKRHWNMPLGLSILLKSGQHAPRSMNGKLLTRQWPVVAYLGARENLNVKRWNRFKDSLFKLNDPFVVSGMLDEIAVNWEGCDAAKVSKWFARLSRSQRQRMLSAGLFKSEKFSLLLLNWAANASPPDVRRLLNLGLLNKEALLDAAPPRMAARLVRAGLVKVEDFAYRRMEWTGTASVSEFFKLVYAGLLTDEDISLRYPLFATIAITIPRRLFAPLRRLVALLRRLFAAAEDWLRGLEDRLKQWIGFLIDRVVGVGRVALRDCERTEVTRGGDTANGLGISAFDSPDCANVLVGAAKRQSTCEVIAEEIGQVEGLCIASANGYKMTHTSGSTMQRNDDRFRNEVFSHRQLGNEEEREKTGELLGNRSWNCNVERTFGNGLAFLAHSRFPDGISCHSSVLPSGELPLSIGDMVVAEVGLFEHEKVGWVYQVKRVHDIIRAGGQPTDNSAPLREEPRKEESHRPNSRGSVDKCEAQIWPRVIVALVQFGLGQPNNLAAARKLLPCNSSLASWTPTCADASALKAAQSAVSKAVVAGGIGVEEALHAAFPDNRPEWRELLDLALAHVRAQRGTPTGNVPHSPVRTGVTQQRDPGGQQGFRVENLFRDVIVRLLRSAQLGRVHGGMDVMVERGSEQGFDLRFARDWIPDAKESMTLQQIQAHIAQLLNPEAGVSPATARKECLQDCQRIAGERGLCLERLLATMFPLGDATPDSIARKRAPSASRRSRRVQKRASRSRSAGRAANTPGKSPSARKRVEQQLARNPWARPQDFHFRVQHWDRVTPSLSIYIDETWPDDSPDGVLAGVVWAGAEPDPKILPIPPQHLRERADFELLAGKALADLRAAAERCLPFIFRFRPPAGVPRHLTYEQMVHDVVLMLLGWILPAPGNGDPTGVQIVCEAIGNDHADGTDHTDIFRGILLAKQRFLPERFRPWVITSFAWRQKKLGDPRAFTHRERIQQGYMAFGDLLSYLTWVDVRAKARKAARLVQLQDMPTCLNIDHETLNLLEQIERHGAVAPGIALQFLADNRQAVFAPGLANQYGCRLRADAGLRQAVLEDLDRRYREKTRDLQNLDRLFGVAMELIGNPGEELPLRLRLLDAAVRLQRSSHFGDPTQVDFIEADYQQLRRRALDNGEAELVAHVELNRIVQVRDTFDAERALLLGEDLLGEQPRLSLLSRAKLHSSIGQDLAMKGELDRARVSFDHALTLIDEADLSVEARAGEWDQTAIYRAISAIDADAEDAPALVSEVLMRAGLGAFSDAVPRLARECRTDDQYRHHLLLRLLDAREDLEEVRQSYLAAMTQDLGVNHPWELIAMCRALMIGDLDAAVDCFQAALDIALAERHGPTLWTIAVMIATAGWAVTANPELRERGRQVLGGHRGGKPLAEILPSAAGMLEVWAQVLDQDQPSTTAIGAVLQTMPFNYR